MTKAVKALSVLLFMTLTISGALAAEKKNKSQIKTVDNYVAIFDFEVRDKDKDISRPLADKVIHVFSESNKYEVIDRSNMNKILGEQKFQLSGCVAQECKVEAGQLLGVGKIVNGSVGLVGKTYYLTIQLIDVKTGKVELSAEDECKCEIDELLGSTMRLTKKLLGEKVEQPVAIKPSPSKAAIDIPKPPDPVVETIARPAEPEPKITKSMSGVAFAGQTFDSVKAKGFVQVGVNGDLFGFGKPDEKGVWRGLDVDTARAIAAAVFGDTSKIKFVPLTAVQRFTALQAGEVDVLCRNATHTLGRNTELGLDFVQPIYYDGQGFLVPKKLKIKRAKELDGATVCVLPGTTTELNVANYFRVNKMKMKPVVIEQNAELNKAFFAGRCDCMTSDASQLAGVRAVAPNPDDYMLLPDIISKEPLATAVRHGDNRWKNIVNYSVLAMIEAEELGITSKNVDEMLKSTNPLIMRFLGVTPGNGKALGLSEKWAYNIVKLVGNYDEVFERNVGKNTPLKLERGLNALWKDGGIMYSPPFK